MTTDERIAELEDRLRLMELERDEHDRGRNPFRLIRDITKELVPSQVQRHVLAARRENLLAARAYLDRAIARVEDSAARVRTTDTTPGDTL